MLDVVTLHVAICCAMFFMGGVLLLIQRVHPDEKALTTWAIGNLLSGLGTALFGIPSYAAYSPIIFAANILIACGAIAHWLGLKSFYKQDQPWRFLTSIFLLYTLIVFNFTVLEPLLWPRLLVTSLFIGLVSIISIVNLYQATGGRRTIVIHFLAAVSAAHSATFFLRGGYAVLSRPESGYTMLHSNFASLAILESMLAAFAMNICYLLLVSDRLQKRLNWLAATDDLTNLFNRRAFKERAEVELVRAHRRGEATAILMLDLDNFKTINDRFGHNGGDRILKRFGKILQRMIRAGDIAARLGGEEFCIMLPSSNPEDAHYVAERIRRLMQQTQVSTDQGVARTTVSIGLAMIRPGESLDVGFRQADRALYAAKRAGRNRIYVELAPQNSDRGDSFNLEWVISNNKNRLAHLPD